MNLRFSQSAQQPVLYSRRRLRCALFVVLLSLVNAPHPIRGQAGPLGSVGVTGAVELRGVALIREGTVFPGDTLLAREGGYAKVSLRNGQSLEIASNTEVRFARTVSQPEILLLSGNMAFGTKGSTPLKVIIGPFELTSAEQVSGNAGFFHGGSAGLRILTGSVFVRSSGSGISHVVSAGEERTLVFDTLQVQASLSEIGSALPEPVPPIPAAAGPTGIRGAFDRLKNVVGRGLKALVSGDSPQTWLLVGGIGAAVVARELSRDGNAVSQPSAIMTQTVQLALEGAERAGTAAQEIATVSAEVNRVISAATELPPPDRERLSGRAEALEVRAMQALERIAALKVRLEEIRRQLQMASNGEGAVALIASANMEPEFILTLLQNGSGTGSGQLQSEMDAIIAALNDEIAGVNKTINELNQLITEGEASGVENLPSVQTQTVPGVTTASSTVPPPS